MENSSDSKVANGTSSPAADPPPGSDPATKPVNPLRLARPLEKSPAGLSKTSFPSGRPMPMPTINPLCPPGSNQGGKNGLKPPAETTEEDRENTLAESSTGSETEKEKVAETKIESKGPAEKEELPVTEKTPPEDPETKASSDKPVEAPKEEKESPAPAPAPAPVKDDQTKDDSKPGKDVSKPESNTESPKEVSEPDKKISEPAVTESPPQESPSGKKKKIAGGPKIPVAEKTPRQPKRKESQELEPLGDEEKRTSKRSRAPPEVYMSPDPEMAHILKTIKKQEEEEKKSTVKNGNSDEGKEKASDSKKGKPKEKKPAKSLKAPSNRRKKKVQESESEEEEESEEETGELEEESEDDDDYKPVSTKKTPPRKPIRKSKVNNGNDTQRKKSGKKDPVFFKDEYLAVRNDEGSFYLCKAMQNIYIGSRNITIQWFSNEDHIIPAKDNPKQDLFAPDFYDKTEFETILTSVELDKVLGKSKRMILPEEELARVKKILQRSNEKAEGKLDMSNIQLSEDNPDGLDISLYKGEDQLDEIEKRRTEKEKTPKRKRKVSKDDESSVVLSESKKARGRPKKEAAGETQPEQTPADTGVRREKRKASKNMNYDQFDFLEEDDDEVMPAPKKRKSQDSVTSHEENKKEEKKEKKTDEKEDSLSTSERAIIQAGKDKSEAGDNSTSNTANQPVKKRGRKPKTKDE